MKKIYSLAAIALGLAFATAPSFAQGPKPIPPKPIVIKPAPPAPKVVRPAPPPPPRPEPKKRIDYLERERDARAKTPEVAFGIKRPKPFVRRLPPHWRELDVADIQIEKAYKIQKDYYDEIALLQARIERLEEERDAKLRGLLTPRQRERFDDEYLPGPTPGFRRD
ncbi:MAG: hypothetical protein IJM30_11380 [Thermoguttaceae bacterium]|nr:hypothetical protein [Thermoguttaceae bacterium]